MKHDKFPLFIDTCGKEVLVVGAGKIAIRRIETLTKFSFKIDVVARTPSPKLLKMEKSGQLNIIHSDFQDEMISSRYFLVIAATNQREINRRIGELAKEAGCYASIADMKEECNVFFPAVREYKDVVVAIAGDGSCHSRTKGVADAVGKVLKSHEDSSR